MFNKRWKQKEDCASHAYQNMLPGSVYEKEKQNRGMPQRRKSFSHDLMECMKAAWRIEKKCP